MDILVQLTDYYVLEDWLYSKTPPELSVAGVSIPFSEGSIGRQTLTLYLLLTIGGYLMYFLCAGASYFYLITLNNEYYFPNRDEEPDVKKEITRAVTSIPIMGVLTTPIVMPEVRGYSLLYSNVSDYGLLYLLLILVWFIVFTDALIYWIHRGLHWGPFYRYIHKDHHAYVNSMSPFASHAFHPVDGWAQSLPYHMFVYFFPIHKWAYVIMFICVNIWTISIHDMVYVTRWDFVNGAAHHTLHHSLFNYNYGQYFTFWDRICGTHKSPPLAWIHPDQAVDAQAKDSVQGNGVPKMNGPAKTRKVDGKHKAA